MNLKINIFINYKKKIMDKYKKGDTVWIADDEESYYLERYPLIIVKIKEL